MITERLKQINYVDEGKQNILDADSLAYRLWNKDFFVKYSWDLTETNTAMTRMHDANERLQIMLDAVPLSCTLLNSNYNFIDCNRETLNLFGISNKQEFTNHFFDFSPEYQLDGQKSTDKAFYFFNKAFGEGNSHFEWQFLIKGALVPCEVSLVRVEIKGQYVFACYIRDLKEHKALLNEINNESERYKVMAHWYESLLDSIPFLISAQDINANWTFINAAAEKFLKTKRGEIVGKPCKNWGLSICNTDECAIACAKRGKMRTFFSSENISFQVDTKLLEDLNGKTAGFIEIIQDVTQIEDMMKCEVETEAANKAKSTFLAAMSHEMRTPLNTIIGMGIIGKNAEYPEGKNYALGKIEEASKHLLGVINDVLDMSKIEMNKLELSHIAFDLRTSIKKAISLVQFNLEEKHLKFSVKLDKKTPHFFIGDDQRLTQVITNLLSNAVKFTPEEGEISLAVSSVHEEGICEIRFEVTDSGIGISPEHHEKIFHPFEQAEGGTTRKYGGTGLGLAISKNIVELMGGRIWVESELGKGARFIFTIKPLIDTKDSLAQCDSAIKEEITLEDIYNRSRGKKVLIAEDIDINREVLIGMLDGSGLIFDTAENGKEALDMVTAEPDKYDLIFMDMQMPIMDGLEATVQIRALNMSRKRNLPIIALTANVFQEDIEKCFAAGMDDHIGKPIDITRVLEKLRDYL